MEYTCVMTPDPAPATGESSVATRAQSVALEAERVRLVTVGVVVPVLSHVMVQNSRVPAEAPVEVEIVVPAVFD
jgi:hypothetical protein